MREASEATAGEATARQATGSAADATASGTAHPTADAALEPRLAPPPDEAALAAGGDVTADRGRPAPLGSTAWAFALNRTALTDDVEVTLLAFTVVEAVVRVSALVRVRRRHDLRLSRVPELAISTLDGPRLTQLTAHVLPQGDLAWVSWVFERPKPVLVEYEARIEQLDLAYRVGGRSEESSRGPWVFHFRLPHRADSPRRRRPMLD
ncbi:MAG: hypothetical protein ACOYXS_05795 [Chloroflexota bacterium]